MWKKITMAVCIDDDAADNLSIITHHIERFIDLESWPEIQGICDVKIEDYNQTFNKFLT